MTKGFITLAVGDDSYYRLAENLLVSYKSSPNCTKPFAIISDRENEFTEKFDKVIILSNPQKSYLDKIEMFNFLPWDENIFIDADCLIYNEVSSLFNLFPDRGVSCFGREFDLHENGSGWFDYKDVQEYKQKIRYKIGLHGGIMFIKKDETTLKIYEDCKNIISHYKDFKFRMFTNPADEPIVALAMAANNCRPIQRTRYCNIYGFYPTFKKSIINIRKRQLSYSTDGETWVKETKILHWQNYNTKRPLYKRECEILVGKNFLLSYMKYVLKCIPFLFLDLKSFIYNIGK